MQPGKVSVTPLSVQKYMSSGGCGKIDILLTTVLFSDISSAFFRIVSRNAFLVQLPPRTTRNVYTGICSSRMARRWSTSYRRANAP